MKINLIILLLLSVYPLFSHVLSDINDDHEITIEIKNPDDNEKVDKSESDNTDDTNDQNEDNDDIKAKLGDKWYSRNNALLIQKVEIGLSGSKDYINESFLFKFRFKSKIKHAFSIRLYHIGYSPGTLTGNFTFYNFSILAGFEYMYKIFNNTSGFFLFLDFGGCNNGIAFDLGVGIGSRVKNGVELMFSYLHNTGIFSMLNFYFLVLRILTLRGIIGIDCKYTDFNIEVFTFKSGFFMGFFIKNIFKIEFGGGLTINNFSAIRGFGGINLSFNIF